MSCAVCDKPATIVIKVGPNGLALCDKCARTINEEIKANLEDK